MTAILPGLMLTYPIDGKGVYTAFYGETRPYRAWGLEFKHEGVDIAPLPVPWHVDALAAYAGRVYDYGYSPRDMGHWVELSHQYEGEQFFTRYHHLSTVAVLLDDEVAAGKRIGVLGNTGNATGIHLHFMVYVKRNGKPMPLDPLWYLPIQAGRGVANG